MYEIALKIINEIHNLGYEAYIVGGFARDKYLHKNTFDIDLCTNLVEDKLLNNFNVISKSNYGSFIITESNYNFEITIFRKEIYTDSRYPKIEYVQSLEEDLKRRDFTINTLCIDSSGNYVDLYNAREDIDNKIIKVVGDISNKMIEDPLRIIRAIRFAVDLDFNLENKLFEFIKNNGFLIKKITHTKLLKEINKVQNKEKFVSLLKLLDLEQYIQ